tara:strand:+ start:1399 stop:1935 length:537 start_codon:yes stop_codon:yes gene_type:complete
MNIDNLSIKQREQLGINYIDNNTPLITKDFSNMKIKYNTIELERLLENDNPFSFWKKIESPNERYGKNYMIDFMKITSELNKHNNNFKGVKMNGKSDFKIDESILEHFTQILYIIHQDSYIGNKWIGWEESFTKDHLYKICKKDINIYLESWGDEGKEFTNKFPEKIDYFIDNFCKEV